MVTILLFYVLLIFWKILLWRRMLRIPWTTRKRNEDVLEEAEKDREVVRTIRRRQMQFTGHIRRASGL